ncbi:uncharacterized protein LOC126842329 [Adelges cooleyi]|uniref:uncharacterized protein LOC126842329 n=1 Tax=Adelges cooleyi TaxID=133065 RepID=UPI0021805736|nr:uncharacterized protein LOC126842329 [Adelges cooleyi]
MSEEEITKLVLKGLPEDVYWKIYTLDNSSVEKITKNVKAYEVAKAIRKNPAKEIEFLKREIEVLKVSKDNDISDEVRSLREELEELKANMNNRPFKSNAAVVFAPSKAVEMANPDEDDMIKKAMEENRPDPRFPNVHTTRYCYNHYIDYHRCRHLLGEEEPSCEIFRKTYTRMCPNSWVNDWDEQREQGIFPRDCKTELD